MSFLFFHIVQSHKLRLIPSAMVTTKLTAAWNLLWKRNLCWLCWPGAVEFTSCNYHDQNKKEQTWRQISVVLEILGGEKCSSQGKNHCISHNCHSLLSTVLKTVIGICTYHTGMMYQGRLNWSLWMTTRSSFVLPIYSRSSGDIGSGKLVCYP